MEVDWDRFVKTEPCSELSVIAVHVGWAQVVSDGGVEPLRFGSVDPPDGLIRGPIHKVIAGTRCDLDRTCKLPWVVRGAKLIKARITFSCFNVVEATYRGCLLARSKPDLRYIHHGSSKLRNEPCRIVRVREPIGSEYHRFSVETRQRNHS